MEGLQECGGGKIRLKKGKNSTSCTLFFNPELLNIINLISQLVRNCFFILFRGGVFPSHSPNWKQTEAFENSHQVLEWKKERRGEEGGSNLALLTE